MVLNSKAVKRPPLKKKLNLIVRENKAKMFIRYIPLYIIVAVLAVLFAKFAVADRMNAVTDAEAKAAASASRLNSLVAGNSRYETVLAEYNRFFNDTFNDESYFDRILAISMVDSIIRPVSTISSYSIDGNKLTVKLSVGSLDIISGLLSSLSTATGVESVTMSSIISENSSSMLGVTFTVMLTKIGGNN